MASSQDIQPPKMNKRGDPCVHGSVQIVNLNSATQKISIIATESKRHRHMTPLTTALFLSTIVTRTGRGNGGMEEIAQRGAK